MVIVIVGAPSSIVVQGIAHTVKAGPATQNWYIIRTELFLVYVVVVLGNIFPPASAGADDGGEVGGTKQGVLRGANPAPGHKQGREKSLTKISVQRLFWRKRDIRYGSKTAPELTWKNICWKRKKVSAI